MKIADFDNWQDARVLYYHGTESVSGDVVKIDTDDDDNITKIYLELDGKEAGYYGLDFEQEIDVEKTDKIKDLPLKFIL